MVILLSGGTEMARQALMSKILKENDDWRHLSLEHIDNLVDTDSVGALFGEDEGALMLFACHCAQEMEEQGFHMVFTHTDATDIVDSLRGELFEAPFLAIDLNPEAEQIDEEEHPFDHVLNTKTHSINDAYELIGGMLDELREELLEAENIEIETDEN